MNGNNNNYYSKIKIDYLISENDNLNKEVKKLKNKFKILKQDTKMIETLNYNINMLKQDMKMIDTLNYNINMLKQDIKTIKLKNKNDETENDEYIQIY
jgi:hypothetical protein